MRPAAVLPVVLLALSALSAMSATSSSSRAAEFSGSMTTIFRAHDLLHVELQPDVQRVISYRPLDQSVRLTWDEMGKRNAWTLDVALRGRIDLGTGKGRWQEDDFDVLLAHARWRSKERLVGLTLGRQQAITGLGWHAFDGVRLDFDKSRRVRASVHAGFPVELWEGGASDTDGSLIGFALTAVFPKHGSLGVDYGIRRGDGVVSDAAGVVTEKSNILLEETAGFEAAFRAGRTSLHVNADYSLLLDELAETTAIVGHSVKRKHHLEARWTRVRPIFPSDSIFAVFELNPYDETRLQYEFRGDGTLDLGGYISFEDYAKPEITTPPTEPVPVPDDLPEDIRRLAATMRWEGRHEAVHRSELGWQRGWTGGRLALMHDSDWGLNPRWRVGAGASMHRYENRYRLVEKDEVFALRGRIRYDHDGKWNLALEVEQFLGRDRDTARGQLVFGTRFGKARGDLPWWGGRWNRSTPERVPAIPNASSHVASAGEEKK